MTVAGSADDRPSIQTVFEALGGRTARWRSNGWSAVYCVDASHEDRTPSAQLNEDTGRYRCLACGFNVDVYGLVMRVEGLGFRAAVARAAELAGSETPTYATPSGKRVARRITKGYTPPWLRK